MIHETYHSQRLHRDADDFQQWGFIFLTLLAVSLFILACAGASGATDCVALYAVTSSGSGLAALYYFRQCRKLRERAFRRAELERRQNQRDLRRN